MLRSIALHVLAFIVTITHVDAVSSYLGCYSSSQLSSQLSNLGSFTFQSVGYCSNKCAQAGSSVFGLTRDECWCGNDVPAQSDRVDRSECDVQCPGYPMKTCGGATAFDIYYIGIAPGDASLTTSVIATASAQPDDATTTAAAAASTSATATEAASIITPTTTTSASTARIIIPPNSPVTSAASNATAATTSTAAPQSTGAAAGMQAGFTGWGLAAGFVAVLLGL